MIRKSISLNEETYNELTSLISGYKESMDTIVRKCIQSYKKEQKLK
jgi:predicted CopG family antitoxin